MKSRHFAAAFTLIELLVVIAIIGIIAAIVGPSLTHFRKGDALIAGTRQMLDAVGRARQLAISQHTTVYLVFVPPNFWTDPAYMGNSFFTQADREAATNLIEKQLTGYNFVSLRSIGDQPGQGIARYLSSWQTLPDSVSVEFNKMVLPRNQSFTIYTNVPPAPKTAGYPIYGFDTTVDVPFPLAQTKPSSAPPGRPYVALPYIAFDYLGKVVPRVQSGVDGEFIPLVHGSVSYTHDPVTKLPGFFPPDVRESPSGNGSNSYNIVHVDWLTGRARLEHQEVQ